MKKFFSLLCATLLVFSASAAPVAKKAEIAKKAPVAVEQVQKVQFEKAQIANFNQLSATPAVKVNNFKPQSKIGPKELAAQSRSVAPKKAPQGYTSTYNYKCGPTEVVVTDLSTPTYNQFKLAITQKAKNTSEYTKETLYDNTVELIIDPDEHSIVGTFTTDDYTIDANTFLKSGSNTRYVSYWENSTITIVSKGGNKYAITDGLLQVESSNGNYLYKYDYCYAAADLNNQDAEKTAFEFTFGEEPTPATWDTIGKSSVKDGVVAYLLGNTEDAAAYNVTTLQKGNSYKMVNLFGSANPAYNKIKDLASYKKAEIEIDATDANNVTIAKQKIGWTGTLFQEVYEIEASNGKLENGVITFAAANIKFYEDGTTPYGGYGDLVITLPKEEPAPTPTLAEKYTANGSKYDGTSKTWIPQQSWTLKTGADEEGNYLNGILPALAGTYPVSYTVEDDSVLVIQPGFVDYQSGVLVSIENASAEDGCIRFIAGKDKSLKLKNSTDVIMYGAYDPSTYNFLGTFGQYTSLTYTEQAPITERDTVDVVSTKMTFHEFLAANQAVQFYAGSDAEGYTTFLVTSKNASTIDGTFELYGGGTCYADSTDGSKIFFTDGQITIVKEDDVYHLTGWVIGDNEKYYRLDWKEMAGVLEYDTDAPFDATFAYNEMDASIKDGVISISLQKGTEIAMDLELYADPAATTIPEGTYTISDSKEAGTALQSTGYGEQGPAACYAATLVVQQSKLYLDDMWFLVEGTVTLSYDEYGKLKVVVDAKNSYGQPVTALVQYVKLEPKSTVDIVSTNLSYTDEWYAKYGIQEFVLTNDNYGVLLDIFADTLVGEFTEEDVDFTDSYIMDFNTDAKIPVVNTGDIVVTLDGKNLALTATLIGADTIQYNISATGYLGYIQGDAVEGYVGEFAVEEVAIQEITLSKVKYIYIQGTNAAGDQLALVVKGKLEDGAIAAGTYTEVMACTGFDAKGQLAPSYVGNNAGVWFIQSGELVVNENGAMAFAGVNSYDAPVAIGFTVPTPEVTDYYLVGWINGAAYGIEGDIDNFGDYHFVDGKVKATFNELSYVQVKDNNKQIYGTDSYKAPVNVGNALLFKTGTEKIAINGGAEYEYTLTVYEDGTLEILYEEVTTDLRNAKANVKAAKQIKNGQIVIVRENKEYNILGAAL